MINSNFTWKPFYCELADKILLYAKKRNKLVEKINKIYTTLGVKNPLISNKKGQPVLDIDPFTVLALINRGITINNRINALREFKKEFRLASDVPSDFDGVPNANNMNAWFFTYDAGLKTGSNQEIDTLWNTFKEAYKYNKTKTNRNTLASAISASYVLYGVKLKITIGLFWFFPDTFVALDGLNRGFIKDKNIISKDQLEVASSDASAYLDLCDNIVAKAKLVDNEIDNLCDLSYVAYNYDISKEKEGTCYFFISADANQFSFNKIPIGELVRYGYKNEKNHYKKISRNFKSAKAGDLFVCYDSTPVLKAVCLCELINNVKDDYIEIKKIAVFNPPISYNTIMALPALAESEYVKNVQGTLFKLTKDEYDAIISLTSLSYSEKSPVGYNKIYYGLPGCGKSYKIEKDVLKGVSQSNYIRTIFYQDYSYTDFVGQIMPVGLIDKDGNKKVSYEFKPGPFVSILKKAYQSPSETFYLVIEELNRGNAPSIFGDLFQLLDRNNDGESEYPISNKTVSDYLDGILPNKFDCKIYIPSNLIILATMNTSDQNVFTLDTAFKRRWEFEEIRNDFVNHTYANKCVPNTIITWQKFVEVINDFIVNMQTGISSSEDKRLGAYFVTEKELTDNGTIDNNAAQRFAYKVLEYLWDDVARFHRDQIFKPEYKTLTSLIDAFVGTEKLNVFIDSIKFE